MMVLGKKKTSGKFGGQPCEAQCASSAASGGYVQQSLAAGAPCHGARHSPQRGAKEVTKKSL